MMLDIRDQCRGRIDSVLIALGYDKSLFSGKHQPCPECGGKDRWRWNRDKEYGICNQGCSSFQFMDMAIRITAISFKETAAHIRRYRIDKMEMTNKYDADEAFRNQEAITALKPGLKRLTGSCPASLYLQNRGLSVLPAQHVWHHANIKGYPAMVAMFSTSEGDLSTLHVTALTHEGKKADIKVQKRIMKVVRPMTGGAIRLFKPENGYLAVAEGIETALAVHELDGLPVWACGNAAMMEKLELPDDITELYIYADNDANYTGQKAAYTLANRCALKGIKAIVEVADRGDFLDDLTAGKQSAIMPRHNAG